MFPLNLYLCLEKRRENVAFTFSSNLARESEAVVIGIYRPRLNLRSFQKFHRKVRKYI